MNLVTIVLGVLALVLAGIEQFQAQGRSLLAWAVIALALIVLISGVPLR